LKPTRHGYGGAFVLIDRLSALSCSDGFANPETWERGLVHPTGSSPARSASTVSRLQR
jgi:hypothetical protein